MTVSRTVPIAPHALRNYQRSRPNSLAASFAARLAQRARFRTPRFCRLSLPTSVPSSLQTSMFPAKDQEIINPNQLTIFANTHRLFGPDFCDTVTSQKPYYSPSTCIIPEDEQARACSSVSDGQHGRSSMCTIRSDAEDLARWR